MLSFSIPNLNLLTVFLFLLLFVLVTSIVFAPTQLNSAGRSAGSELILWLSKEEEKGGTIAAVWNAES